MGLVAEAVDDPQDETEQDAGRQRKGDEPAATTPVEVSGKSPQWEMETAEADHDEACYQEKTAEQDEDAA